MTSEVEDQANRDALVNQARRPALLNRD
jgi:hypothetical protein